MANKKMLMRAGAAGTYDGVLINLPTTEVVTVFIPDGLLSMTMKAARSWWSDNNPMEYIITIANKSLLPFEGPITLTTDAFDLDLIDLDDSTVTVTGNTKGAVAFSADGVLSVTLTDDILGVQNAEDPEDEGGVTTITFQITKKTQP